MLNVTEEQIEAYNSNSIHKNLIIRLPETYAWDVLPKDIIGESMTLKEMILDGKNVEFVGCNASEFTVKLNNVYEPLKNKRIEVFIETDDTDPIPLFKGYIYSAKLDGNSSVREIKAYDILYQKGQIDVASWYQGLEFPISIKNLRKSLFNYIDLEYVETTLPNDSLIIEKQYDPKTLKCLSVLKALCQLNGCFGIINREEKFEFRFLKKDHDYVISNNFDFCKSITREEFYVKPFDRVVIRENEQDVGVSEGDKPPIISNKYIVQANMFTYKLDWNTTHVVARNLLDAISDISFTPVNTDNNGMPFVECGDTVTYRIGNARATSSYRVFNRELNGVQALRDKYGADGDEEASEYITDLQTQIDTIKQSGGGGTPEDVYTKEETDERIDEMIAEKSINVVSCTILPDISEREEGTIYLVQGDIFVN